MSETENIYEVFGLTVRSAIVLPELYRAPPGAPIDVTIRLGSIPSMGEEVNGLSLFAEGALLRIPGAGRYWMAHGDEMVVDPDPIGSERNLRLYLLGSAFAAILHQRSLLPLHANAVVIDGRAVAFMGHSGAGKSTLAAWFHDRGFTVLADDVCVVTTDRNGQAMAHPGIPRLRLWREALEASGRTTDAYEMSFDDMDKYNVPTRVEQTLTAVPLDHVYLLEKAADGKEASVDRVAGAASVEALVANTYRGGYVRMMGHTGSHLMACVALTSTAPVFRAQRCWGLDRLDEEGDRIEAHARAIIASRQA